MKSFYRLTCLTALIAAVFTFYSCSEDNNTQQPDQSSAINSCEGCHTNHQALKDRALPDTAQSGGGGCGGEAPHYERYDKVYMDKNSDGFKEFKNSAHGKLACTDCHNGTDKTDDFTAAHSGTFIAHPSLSADEKCGKTCHKDIVETNKNSIHVQGWGQKRKVTMRAGLAGAHEFDKLPESHKEGYNKNCASCHGSCGECHVVRPHAGGEGLANNHAFAKKPDMLNVCITCHVSRGGHAYLGVASGTKPDVHQTKGFNCMSCHKKSEIHGDGNTYEQRYAVASMPKCTDCHSDIKTKNSYHSMHMETFSCNTCHSQPYNNCASCHIGGDGARIPSHQDFKIGMNPLKNLRNFKFALLRQSPMAMDSWSKYGVPAQSNFDYFPTWNYTTPHNILRWTSQTLVGSGKACYDNCHIVKEGATFRNKSLYLFNSDLLDWEKKASKDITVDGKLPKSWGLE